MLNCQVLLACMFAFNPSGVCGCSPLKPETIRFLHYSVYISRSIHKGPIHKSWTFSGLGTFEGRRPLVWTKQYIILYRAQACSLSHGDGSRQHWECCKAPGGFVNSQGPRAEHTSDGSAVLLPEDVIKGKCDG